jgi:hypothetical protein
MDLKDYSLLKILILEEMLGEQTTFEMSQSLGFKFDKYRRWMKNTKILKWSEFEELCSKQGYDLDDALKVVGYEPNDAREVIVYLKEFNNFDTNFQLANFLTAHISVVQRYLSGSTEPDVQTVFKMIGMKPGYLSKFLKRLFKNKIKNIHFNSWIEIDSSTSRLSMDFLNPLLKIATNYCMSKSKQPPTVEWLAETLNIDVNEVKQALRQQDSSSGHYYPNTKIQESSIRIVLANQKSLKKINEIMQNAQSEILKILDNSDGPSSEVGAILLQTFNFNFFKEEAVNKELFNEAI